MSDYTIQVSWSGKDALNDNGPEKVISGDDFNTEFAAIQTAVNSKADTNGDASENFSTNNLTTAGTFTLGGTAVTSTAAELNILDGVTVTATDINNATLNTDTDVSSTSWVVDEDDMTSDLATKVPTQQSVKAYADTKRSVVSARAYRATTDQVPSGSTFVKVQFNAETTDTDNFFDSTTDYDFAPTVAGYYAVHANIWFGGTARTIQGIRILKGTSNVATYFSTTPSNSNSLILGTSTIVYLDGSADANNVITVQGWTDATSPAFKAGSDTNFSATFLGA